MRLPDWETRLVDAIEAARGRPFCWGSHDCATWVAEVRRALTGIDAAASWRGSYATETGARRAIRKHGHASMQDWVSAEVGQPLAAPLAAQRGDIVLDGETAALGICVGAEVAFVTQDGLTFLPITCAAMAWRV